MESSCSRPHPDEVAIALSLVLFLGAYQAIGFVGSIFRPAPRPVSAEVETVFAMQDRRRADDGSVRRRQKTLAGSQRDRIMPVSEQSIRSQ